MAVKPGFQIPFSPSLSPEAFLTPKKNAARRYPFSCDRSYFYYMARNGLYHSVDLLGLTPSDEVLMPSYHHGIEVQVLRHRKIPLRYYRVDEKMRIDMGHLEHALTARSRVLYVIHYFGFPQPIRTLRDFADRHGLYLFEDCALSLLSDGVDGPLGTTGDVSLFCLYKTLAVPHGGVLVVNRRDLPGPRPARPPKPGSTIGNMGKSLLGSLQLCWNGKGHKISRAIDRTLKFLKDGLALERIPVDTNAFDDGIKDLGVSALVRYLIERMDFAEIVGIRRRNFQYMVDSLRGCASIPVTDLPEGTCPLSLPVLVSDKEGAYSRLLKEGVETVRFWSIPNPDTPDAEFPGTSYLRRHLLEVPIHQGLDLRHLDHMVLAIRRSGISR